MLNQLLNLFLSQKVHTCCIASSINSLSKTASNADTWSQVALACKYVDASKNEPKIMDDKIIVNEIILAIFTEFVDRSLYAWKKKT